MSQITPIQVIQWFRDQAAEFEQMANKLEATFSSMPGANPIGVVSTNTGTQKLQVITPELIKSAIKLRGMRVKDFAANFHVTEQSVQSLIKPENRLEIVTGGWISNMDAK